jgi:large subunit ribosomal protein L24
MNKLKIKKGDNVMIIAGDDKGTTGRVLEVYPEKNRLLVEGVNIHIAHIRPSAADQTGGRKEKSLPVHYSNVQLIDSDGNATRLKVSTDTDNKTGKKTKKRIALTNGKEI